MSKRTLKEIALDLLKQYRDAKESLIWEYSGSIDEDTKRLEEEVAKIRQEIEEAAMSDLISRDKAVAAVLATSIEYQLIYGKKEPKEGFVRSLIKSIANIPQEETE